MGLDLRNFAVRCYLIGVARGGNTELPTYGDLHKTFGGGNQNQGRFLELIYEDCVANNEPDVTVVAVSSKTRFPSRFEQTEFTQTPETIERWHAALERIRAHEWSNARLLQAGNPHLG